MYITSYGEVVDNARIAEVAEEHAREPDPQLSELLLLAAMFPNADEARSELDAAIAQRRASGYLAHRIFYTEPGYIGPPLAEIQNGYRRSAA